MASRSICLISTALAVALVMSGAAFSAKAITLGDYQNWRARKGAIRATPQSILQVRLGGVFRGYEWANEMLRRRGAAPFFCPPKDLRIGDKAIIKLLDGEIAKPTLGGGKPYAKTASIYLLLLVAASKKWPCAKKKPPIRKPATK